MFMKIFNFLVTVIIVVLPLISNSSDICYRHYDKNNQLINAGRTPPFDISGPPLSSEYQAAKDRGEYIIIAPSGNCISPDKTTNTTPVKTIGKQDVFSAKSSTPSYNAPTSYQPSPVT